MTEQLSEQDIQRMGTLAAPEIETIQEYTFVLIAQVLAEHSARLFSKGLQREMPSKEEIQSRIQLQAYAIDMKLLEAGYTDDQCQLFRGKVMDSIHMQMQLDSGHLGKVEGMLREALELQVRDISAQESEGQSWQSRIQGKDGQGQAR